MTKKNIFSRLLKQFSRNRYWFLIVFISLPIWFFLIAPFLLKIPTDFSYKADIISVDNFYDEKNDDFQGEQYSNTQFSYEVVDSTGPILVIKNTFHVSTPEGKTIFKTEPLYGVNSFTGQHALGYGDHDRDGYLFAPRGLHKNEAFSYWHVSNNKSVVMRYAGERLLYGLRVLKYESEYQGPFDQTEFMHHLPGVPEERGIKLGSVINLWIEPVSGYIVKMEDYSREYFYFDIKTGQKIAPYNEFLNTYTEQSVRTHVEYAISARNKVIIVQIAVPVVLVLILFFTAIFYSFPDFFIFSPKYFFPGLVFICGLVFTVAVFLYSQNNIRVSEQNIFSRQSDVISDSIKEKMNIYTNVLSGGRGFFDASTSVERDEWQSYINSLNIDKSYPGIQGIGFARVIIPSQKDSFIASVRKEGFSDFSLTPEGDRDIYTSIVYLEPFNERNRRAFGYDMFSEGIRRKAMIRARDTGLPALSGKVILKQETDTDIQNGFLLYVPVYKKNTTTTTTSTINSFSDSIFGYVYAPFRIRDFINSITGTTHYSVAFRLFDGLRTDPDKNMYTSPDFPSEDTNLAFRDIKTLTIAGHPWTIEFVNSPKFERNFIYIRLSYGILMLGFLMSVLGFIILHSLMTSRERAVDYARKVNKKLIKNVQELEHSRDATLYALQDVETEKDKFERANIRLNIATRSAKIGIWELDIIKHHLIWDTQMYALYGYNKKNSPKKAQDIWYESIHPEDKERVNNALQDSINNNQLFDIKFRIIWPDKTLHDIRAFGLVHTDQSNTPVHMVGVNWDITHEALVDRQKTEFVSIASHQLRTPLTSIGWYTEMLLHGDTGEISPVQKKYLNEIYKSNVAMTDLVNKLLSVSRIDLGTLVIDCKTTHMDSILSDILSENKKKISTKKISIIEHIGNIGACLSDPTLVRIILQNLIANAIKYTPQAGKIDISLSLKGKNILFKITDNGRGIPEEQQKNIFQKFFRADNTEDVNGTGLGLYIVRSVVEKLGGKVWFESHTRGVKKGTTFFVEFPFVLDKQKTIKKSS